MTSGSPIVGCARSTTRTRPTSILPPGRASQPQPPDAAPGRHGAATWFRCYGRLSPCSSLFPAVWLRRSSLVSLRRSRRRLRPRRRRPAHGAQAPAAPRLEVTKQQAYGDWVYACVKATGGTETRCQISQQLSDSRTNQPLFAWRITQDGKGGLVGEWETRSGVLVARGIVMDIGSGKPVTVPFQACLPQACTAVAG